MPSESRWAVILTALEVETRSVLNFLSGTSERSVRGTVFFVGNFSNWKIAVAECGEGNVHSAATIERAIAEFNPQVAMFVGVAGGIKDVLIGDVVVSSKIYAYERGKEDEESFKPRPFAVLPAYSLEQRARAVRINGEWIKRLNPELFKSQPKMYIGPIAAGEKVVASTTNQISSFIRSTYGDALAIEMEGQGFLAAVHINAPVQGCVVRGISDLLDRKSESDKAGSQVQAAAAASAVAFEILATLDHADVGRTSSALGSFAALCTNIYPHMRENARIFRDFGPNSGKAVPNEGQRLVQFDLRMWHVKRLELAKNNRKIKEIVQTSHALIPLQYRPIFEKLVSHIDAFDIHLNDASISYSNNQFPKEIFSIIEGNLS